MINECCTDYIIMIVLNQHIVVWQIMILHYHEQQNIVATSLSKLIQEYYIIVPHQVIHPCTCMHIHLPFTWGFKSVNFQHVQMKCHAYIYICNPQIHSSQRVVVGQNQMAGKTQAWRNLQTDVCYSCSLHEATSATVRNSANCEHYITPMLKYGSSPSQLTSSAHHSQTAIALSINIQTAMHVDTSVFTKYLNTLI